MAGGFAVPRRAPTSLPSQAGGVPDPIPPPVVVMLSRPVTALPPAGALPGGEVFEPKFDGWRLVILTGPVRLQTRAGRDVTRSFPEIAEAAAALPARTVLDGELVVWSEGRVDFGALQSRGLGRPKLTPPASYAAFDVLALDGEDYRARPYLERRRALVDLLAPLGPPLQPVPATTDRAEAARWLEDLRAAGIEGLVVKGQQQRYEPGRRGWMKLRHAAPQDAVVVGVSGPVSRLRAVVATGGHLALSAPLSPAVRHQLSEAATAGTGRLGDGTLYRPLVEPVPVEVERQTTRHGAVVVTRVREG